MIMDNNKEYGFSHNGTLIKRLDDILQKYEGVDYETIKELHRVDQTLVPLVLTLFDKIEALEESINKITHGKTNNIL